MLSDKNKLQEFCQKSKISLPKYKSSSIDTNIDTNGLTNLRWTAEVKLNLNGQDLVCTTKKNFQTKAEAEKYVANKMLKYVQKKSPICRKKITNPSPFPSPFLSPFLSPLSPRNHGTNLTYSAHSAHSTYVSSNLIDNIQNNNFDNIYVIDLENKPQFNLEADPSCLYLGFINSIHHSMPKYNEWYKCSNDDIAEQLILSSNNKLIYCVEGGINDLADHFMTAMGYPIINYVENNILKISPGKKIMISIISGDHAGWCTRHCFDKIIGWKNLDIIVTNSVTVN